MSNGSFGAAFSLKITLLLSLIVLKACGGGGDDNPSTGGTNQRPTVSISGPAQVLERSRVTLTAQASDSDGTISSYQWSVDSTDFVIISGQSESTITLEAVSTAQNINGSVRVSVTDNDGANSATTHAILIQRITEQIRIMGKVTDAPIPLATVIASVGNSEFTTTTDNQGDYTLELIVDEDDTSELVLLTANGDPSTHAGVRFMSQLSSFATLQTLANADDELDASLLLGLNISNVTTAEYALLIEAIGSSQIDSESQLNQYIAVIDAVRVIELAALIKIIVDDPAYQLPAGFAHSVEFATSVDAVEQFKQDVNQQDATLLASVMSQVLNDPAIFNPSMFNDDVDGDGVTDSQDSFPFNAAESLDSDRDGIGNNADDDDDNDLVPDANDAFPLDPTESVDTDGDGIGNNADTDDDNDGVADTDDAFPFDASESVDTDRDGIGNNADPDDDNDMVLDTNDAFPLDPTESVDTDGDGVGNNADTDDDNDSVDDNNDAFPLDPAASVDTDGDNIGDSLDPDDDNDDVDDNNDAFPLDPNESVDTDGDGIGNNADTDDDNDQVPDSEDAFPLDPTESVDTDGDGIGNNADTDDDNDGVLDTEDAFPFDPNESVDTDRDGIGNNADPDDDNDQVLDEDDAFPLDATETADNDQDGIGNNADPDDDNDGVVDAEDAFPFDPTESLDTDGDGIGNNADTDDDNDQTPDTEDAFPLDPTETLDTDEDSIGNNADPDDDNDGVEDTADAFPLDAAETLDTDNDSIGNNADTDDDNDGISDEDDGFPLISIGDYPDADSDGIPDNCDQSCQSLGMEADDDDNGNGIPDSEEQNANVSVTITSPQSLLTVGTSTVEVTGEVTPDDAVIVLNGLEVANNAGTFTAQVSLEEGANVIEARVTKSGIVQTDSITVALDTIEPNITVDSHVEGQTLYTDTATITGLINDVVRGTVSAEDASVTVNGEAATVANRSYAAEVSLVEGENLITIVGADKVGNTRTRTLTLNYQIPEGRQVVIVSGQAQSAEINAELAEPLHIRVIDENSVPVENANVVFRVIQGDGFLPDADNNPTRAVVLTTNSEGEAQSTFTVGTRVGQLNQKVRASVVGVESNVVFNASTVNAEASIITVNAGNNQRGAVGQRLPQPLVVYVTDDGGNPIAGATVTFASLAGGGHFVEQQSQHTVTSGNDGFASAQFWLGSTTGGDAQRVKATLASGQPGTELSSEFTATAYVPLDAGNTRLTGLVLDTESNPLVGATVYIEDTTRQTQTDENGYFSLTETPVGAVHLLVDGSTITSSSGEYPTLSFHPVLIAGIENTLPQPVYMVQLSETNRAYVSETQDAVVTVEEFPGYKLEIEANSATFPDGSREGIVSISPVNTNRVPMAPPNGMQPQLAVTIQPSGTLFDPPAKITLPNLDGLPPGKQVDMYSFDHDLNEFVSIGLGTVSEDGALVVSNPGVGILKAGWFITPQPPEGEGDVENDPDADPNNPEEQPPEECGRFDLRCLIAQGSENVRDTINDFIDDVTSCDEGELCDSIRDSAQDWLESIGDNISDTSDRVAEGIDDLLESGAELANEAFDKLSDITDSIKDKAQRGLDPIVMATGELEFTQTDLKIPGRGFDFELKRTYRSKIHFNGRVGYNWVFNYYQLLDIPEAGEPSQDITRVMEDGLQYVYVKNQDGSYTSPDSLFDVLRKNNDDTYTIRKPDGFKIHFDATGQMMSQVDRFGNQMDFVYDDEDRLITVIDTLGREIIFSYRSDSGHIDTVTDFSGRSVRYFYDENRDLIAARTPVVTGTPNGNDFINGKFTQYSYSSGFDEDDDLLKRANHNLLEVTDAKGYVYLKNVYNTDPESYEFDRIVEQQYGDDSQVFYASYTELNADDAAPTSNTPRNQTSVIDRNGNLIEYIHNQGGMLLSETHYTNRNVNPADPDAFTTTNTYNDDGLLLSKTLPAGTVATYVYDSGNSQRYMQQNLLSVTTTPGARGAAQAQLVETFNYEPVYTLVNSVTNARGFTTNYTYDYQHADNLAAIAAELGIAEAAATQLLDEHNVSLTGGVAGQIAGNTVREQRPTATLVNGDSQPVVITRSYNDFGQLVEEIDAEGIATQIEYYPENDPDGNGTVTESVRSLSAASGGYKKAVTIDAYVTDRRSRTAEVANITTSYAYDMVGNITAQTDGKGYTTRFIRNALNQVVRKIAPQPFEYLTDYYYDANNNLVRVSSQNVGTTSPNLSGWVHTVYGYNALNDKVSEIVIPEEDVYLTTRYEYDNNQNLIAIQQPEGNRVERVYDERDLVYQVARGAGSDEASTKTMSYDANGNLVLVIDAVDNDNDGEPEETIYTYDGYDRLIRSQDPLGNYATTKFDANGNPVLERQYGNSGISGINNAILLAEISYHYDELDRLYQQDNSLLVNGQPKNVGTGVTPDDNQVTTTHLLDANNMVLSTTDDNGNSTRYTYDGLDRQLTVTDALGNQTTSVFDANNNVIEVTELQVNTDGLVADKTIITTASYDELNRRITQTNALGNTTTWRYDSRGNVILVTDPMTNLTLNIYDGLDRLIESREYLTVTGTGDSAIDTSNPANPDGINTITYGYDGNSNLVFISDDKRNVTTYEFDSLNRQTATHFADGTSNLVEYDADDNAVLVTDQNGSVFTHQYDGLNRLTATSLVPAVGLTGSTAWTYTYDGLSRRITATDNNEPGLTSDDSVVTYRYDSLNHILSETSNQVTTQATYDGMGLRQSLTYGNGRTLNYTYDNIYNLKAIAENDTSIVEYDYAGYRVLARRYQNGTKLSYIEEATDAGYDGINRVLKHVHSASDNSLISGFDYAYDKANNRRYEIDRFAQLADIYEYDSAYRVVRSAYRIPQDNALLQAITNNDNTNFDVAPIVAAEDKSYLLDGVDNWVSVQTLSGSDSDATGYQLNEMNEYKRVGAADRAHDNNGNLTNDGSRQFVYDGKNRLVQVKTLSGNVLAAYKYDAFGRRTVKRAGTQNIQYVYFGKQVFEERNNFAQLQRQYVYGNGIDEVLQLRDAANDDYYYHADFLGSITAITDSSGTVTERYDYNIYGETTILAANGSDVLGTSQIGNSYGFTGRRLDSETGLYYYRARYYFPETGRFIQRDPLGYADGMGVYAYVSNNPINFVDPNGLKAKQAFVQAASKVGDFISNNADTIADIAGYAMDAASLAAIVGDVLTIPSGEGIAATIALQAAKQKAKASVKNCLKKLSSCGVAVAKKAKSIAKGAKATASSAVNKVKNATSSAVNKARVIYYSPETVDVIIQVAKVFDKGKAGGPGPITKPGKAIDAASKGYSVIKGIIDMIM